MPAPLRLARLENTDLVHGLSVRVFENGSIELRAGSTQPLAANMLFLGEKIRIRLVPIPHEGNND